MWTAGSSALKIPAAPGGGPLAGWPPRMMAGRVQVASRHALPGGDGDEEALRFLAAYRGLVESEVQRYARRGGDREELGGEAWLALWEARQLHRAGHHHTDLAHYARNHVHRRVRQAYLADLQRRVQQPAGLPADLAAPGDPLRQVDDWMDVESAWQALAPGDQSVLAAWLAGEARRGPGTPGALKKRRQRAQARLRRALKGPAPNGACPKGTGPPSQSNLVKS